MFTRPSRLAFGAGTLAVSAMFGLFGAIPNAVANEDPALNPPNCSAADLAGVRTGVDAATSAYLFTHPDVNYFYTSLEGLTREQSADQVQTYLEQHPQIQAEMTGIRQPLVDLKNHCGGQLPGD
jgi:hemophore-related protein